MIDCLRIGDMNDQLLRVETRTELRDQISQALIRNLRIDRSAVVYRCSCEFFPARARTCVKPGRSVIGIDKELVAFGHDMQRVTGVKLQADRRLFRQVHNNRVALRHPLPVFIGDHLQHRQHAVPDSLHDFGRHDGLTSTRTHQCEPNHLKLRWDYQSFHQPVSIATVSRET